MHKAQAEYEKQKSKLMQLKAIALAIFDDSDESLNLPEDK